jgi:energy-coupling factor transporter ATP-binding protein EcfA2
MPRHIKSISRIRALGVLEDHGHPAELAEFRRYNLIYGFNGSGKTTLSRILRCVERGAYCEHFPPDAQASTQAVWRRGIWTMRGDINAPWRMIRLLGQNAGLLSNALARLFRQNTRRDAPRFQDLSLQAACSG